jgi:bifunctional DNA-binding transcriptional regulator/antitoxin component of YhaV-PrlF toxin-antitoxin module
MGYPVKLQKVERPTNRSYYVNLPAALAEAMQLEKGEKFEWILEDRNTLILQRLKPLPSGRTKRESGAVKEKA